MLSFAELNAGLDALKVLQELKLEMVCYTRGHWRGQCPFHESKSRRPRSLVVSMGVRKWICHRCGAHGDMIDLWAGVRKVSLREAAEQLQRRFG